jgi:hypothetical protein
MPRFTRCTPALAVLLSVFVGCADEPTRPEQETPTDTNTPQADASDAGSDSIDAEAPRLNEEAIDLVAWSRLSASAVRSTALWPREDQVAIATIRDDAESTAFAAPADTAVALCVDWQPWVTAALLLDEVRVNASADAFPIQVRSVAACGVQTGATELGTLSGPANQTLALTLAPAGALELTLAPGADVQVRQIQVFSRDSRALPPALPLDISTRSQVGGVIEGFYGVPWSWREREDLLRVMAQGGLQTFVYAPKRDPLHRDEWRGEYPQAFVDRFGQLAVFGESLDVNVYFGISPFIDYDDATDYPVLLQKMQRFVAVGLRGVMLLADDIEDGVDRPIDAALGALHVDVANRLLADLRAENPEIEFWFVPTVYSDERLTTWPQGEAYLAEMTGLNADIEVLWTGPGTFNRTLDASDTEVVSGIIGRTPYIWDNYWANDAGDGLFGRILLAPTEGRDASLLPAVRGIAHNPLIQGALTRLNIAGFAAWMAAPSLSPADQRQRAVQSELQFALRAGGGTSLAPTLDLLMRVFDGHGERAPAFEQLATAVDSVLALDSLNDGALPALQQALRTFADMVALQSTLYHSTAHPDLVDDALFPLRRVTADGVFALARLMQFRERVAGRPDDIWAAVAAQATADADGNRFQYSVGVPSRLDALLNTGLRAPVESWTLPAFESPCTVGSESIWTLDAEWVWAAGLPGGSQEGANTLGFTAEHPGVYDVTVVATRALPSVSWSVHQQRITCL